MILFPKIIFNKKTNLKQRVLHILNEIANEND